MNRWHEICFVAIVSAMLVLVGAAQEESSAQLPRESYYQLDVSLETHRGAALQLSDLQGTPVVLAMFYASCPHVCPMTISAIRAIEAQLPPEDREELRVLLVTFDPERDTPAVLTELADRHGVNNDRWQFARTAPEEVRVVAAVLGIQYRESPDGEFNHSSPILLLDATGRELSRSHKPGAPDAVFAQEVAAAAHAKSLLLSH